MPAPATARASIQNPGTTLGSGTIRETNNNLGSASGSREQGNDTENGDTTTINHEAIVEENGPPKGNDLPKGISSTQQDDLEEGNSEGENNSASRKTSGEKDNLAGGNNVAGGKASGGKNNSAGGNNSAEGRTDTVVGAETDLEFQLRETMESREDS